MAKLIRNRWEKDEKTGVETASILRHDEAPEGLDFARVRFPIEGTFRPASDQGSILSVLRGRLQLRSEVEQVLQLRAGVHVYLPPDCRARLQGQAGAELVIATAPKATRARGQTLLLRDDQFLAACATGDRALRWILTPQYLSRRVFLHHDRTLLSLRGEPLSWFHTTMFDVDGLPLNDQGMPVFKMSYNYRTEPNICYDVQGMAKVRMAEHPYQDVAQSWRPWQDIDGECTYHLDEPADMAEWREDASGRRPLRNKHEVWIEKGHVSLICMHDPAPTGAERHSAGTYSEYGELARTLGSHEYDDYLHALKPLDHMVDTLSLAKAKGETLEKLSTWGLYVEGLAAQRTAEAALREELAAEGHGRERIVTLWMLT